MFFIFVFVGLIVAVILDKRLANREPKAKLGLPFTVLLCAISIALFIGTAALPVWMPDAKGLVVLAECMSGLTFGYLLVHMQVLSFSGQVASTEGEDDQQDEIAALKEEIEELEGEISTFRDEKSEYESSIVEHQREIDNAQSEIADIDAAIADRDRELAELRHKLEALQSGEEGTGTGDTGTSDTATGASTGGAPPESSSK